MAHATIGRFDRTIKKHMRNFFRTLSEKDQRRYAAIEAQRLGPGGMGYISEVLGCSTRTIRRGMNDLEQLPQDPAAGCSVPEYFAVNRAVRIDRQPVLFSRYQGQGV